MPVRWNDLLGDELERTMDLTKVELRHSPLTDTIFLCRFGSNRRLALDKREAEADVFAVLVAHMMHDAPKGSEKVITLGEQQYTIRVTPNAQRNRRDAAPLED